MKILQIIQQPQLRGAEMFACQLSKCLKKSDCYVDILYLFNDDLSNLSFDLDFYPLNAIKSKRFYDFKAYRKLAKIINQGGYDIVQANAGDTLKYAAISKKIYGWKALLVFRNANKISEFIRSKWHKRLTNFFLGQVDYIVSVSENCRADIIDVFPKARKISKTITIGTYDFFECQYETSLSSEVNLINIGSFVPEKNHVFLIEIFNEYLKHNKSAKLTLVGDGRERKAIERIISHYRLESSVELMGYQKDVISLIRKSKLLVMPSKIEGLPGVILEAMSCGKPVIASKVGGIPEVVKDGYNGYTLANFNVNEYVQKINKVLSDQRLYDSMCKHSRVIVKDHFLLDKVAADFLSVYRRLASKHQVSGR